MTEAEFRALCLAFPETVEGANMGSTYFKANGKDLARILGAGRVYFAGVPVEEIEMLTEAEPDVFWADGHYKNARSVVATLTGLDVAAAKGFLDRRFRKIAKKAVLKAWEISSPPALRVGGEEAKIRPRSPRGSSRKSRGSSARSPGC